MLWKGYLFAILAAITIAAETVFGRFALLEWGANTFVFVLVSLFISSFVQLQIAGYSHGGWFVNSLKQFHTWLYTFLQIGMYMCMFMILLYITTVEGTLLARFSVVTSVVLAWLFFGRKPKASDLPWALIITAAYVTILIKSQAAEMTVVVVLAILHSLFLAGRSMVAEAHPTYLKASNLLDRMRVTGTIMLITSFVMLVIAFALSIVKPQLASVPVMAIVPDLSAFTHKPTFYAAFLIGVTILPIDIYANFRATSLLNAERALMMRSLVPVVTLMIEWPLSAISKNLTMRDFDMIDVALGIAIVFASMAMLIGRKHISKALADDLDVNNDEVNFDQAANDIHAVYSTVEHFGGDVETASKHLGLTPDIINKMLSKDGAVLSVEASRELHNNFLKNVAFLDPLTGLINRTEMTRHLTQQIDKNRNVILLYIDLDKFKPINDSYGHEVGDEVLRIVALRLRSEARRFKGAVAARLGGDEFALIIPSLSKKQAQILSSVIKKKFSNPIRIDGRPEKPVVGASIGWAESPVDGLTPSTLLSKADSRMYEDKGR